MWPHAFQELPIDYSDQLFLVNCQKDYQPSVSANIDMPASKVRGRCKGTFVTLKTGGEI